MKYTVKKGDTLSQITPNWQGVKTQSGNPDLIFPNEVLDIPDQMNQVLPPVQPTPSDLPFTLPESRNMASSIQATPAASPIDQILPATPSATPTMTQDILPTPTPTDVPILDHAPITQAYGNYNPGLYKGINASMTNTGTDFGAPEGTPIHLPQGKWEVVEQGTGWNRGYGNSTMVKNKETGEMLRFSHLSKMHKLEPGQEIQGGQLFGLVGKTGHTTGSHLDLEAYDENGNLVDVMKTRYGHLLQ